MKIRRRLMIYTILVLAIIGGAAIVFYFSRLFVPDSLNIGDYTTEIIDRGRVISAIKATGVVESESEVLVLSPASGIIKSIMAEPGSRVRKNDIILKLDTEEVTDQIDKIKDQLEVMSNNLKRTRLNAQSTRLDLEYNEEVKNLKITSLKSQLADQEQLLEVGGISPAKIEQTKQEITLAKKDLETLIEKNSIRLKQLETEERGLILQIRIQEKVLEEKEELLQKMNIRAPSSGILLSVTGHEGEKVKQDNLLVRMSDLSSFKITGSIDEKFAKQLKTGNKVLVALDNEQLEGTVGNITPMVENSKVQFNVHLKESTHPKLIANQQIQIQIINNLKENALRIKKLPDLEKSKTLEIFVIEGSKAVKKEITLGITGNEYCEILSGVEEGDVVIAEGFNSFRHLDEIEIEK